MSERKTNPRPKRSTISGSINGVRLMLKSMEDKIVVTKANNIIKASTKDFFILIAFYMLYESLSVP